MMVCGRGIGRHILLWSLPLMSLLCWEAVVNAQCIRFEFPTAQNPNDTTKEPIVETTENQPANIVFNIDIRNCSDTAQVSVIISKMNQTTKLYEDFCKLQVNAGKADVFYEEDKCRGGESNGSYSLSKHVDRSDNTSWRWRGSYKGQRSQQTVRMLVRCAPRTTVPPLDNGEKGDEEEEESGSHISDTVIATIIVVIIGGAVLGFCNFFLFRRFKGRVSSHSRIGRRRDVTEQPQGDELQEQESTYQQPANSGTSPDGGERGSHCYQVLQPPSPPQEQVNIYHQPANSRTLPEGEERGSHCYQVLETFSPPPNNIYEEPKEPSSYSVPPPPRPAFSS